MKLSEQKIEVELRYSNSDEVKIGYSKIKTLKNGTQRVTVHGYTKDLQIDSQTGKYYIVGFKPVAIKSMSFNEILKEASTKPGMTPEEYSQFEKDNSELLDQFFAGGGVMMPFGPGGFGPPQKKRGFEDKTLELQNFEKLIQDKFTSKGYEDVLVGFKGGLYFMVDFLGQGMINTFEVDEILTEAKNSNINLTFSAYRYTINPYAKALNNKDYNHQIFFNVK